MGPAGSPGPQGSIGAPGIQVGKIIRCDDVFNVLLTLSLHLYCFSRAPKVNLEYRAYRVLKAHQELQGHQDNKGHPVKLEPQVHR